MQIKRFSIKTTYYPYTERDIGGLKWEKSSFDTYPVLPPTGSPWLTILPIYKWECDVAGGYGGLQKCLRLIIV